MIIGVDAGCLGIRDERLKVGVYIVVKNLLSALGKIDKENTYYLYTFYPIEKRVMEQFGPLMKNIVVVPSRGWMKIWLPLRLLRQKPDIFLGLNQALPDKIYHLPKYRSIVLFHDIAFEKYPSMYSYAGSLKKLHNQSKHAAINADVIITVSKSTKKDLCEIYKIEENKITVIYPGVSSQPSTGKDIFSVLKTLGIKNPYFLFVGAFKKTKNIPTIIKAFSYFSEHMSKEYELILVGGDKWIDPDLQIAIDEVPGSIRSRIKMVGFVDDETLAALYKGAEALVSPSHYEGFGLPMLEAMAAGCPVIASNNSATVEIVGYSGLLFDSTDYRSIADGMMKVVKDPAIKKALSDKGRVRAKEFPWEKSAKEMLDIIESRQ